MKLQFANEIKKTQPDPFMCEIPGGWVMYVTGSEGVDAYFCDTPFGRWEYKGIVCKVEGCREYWAPCMQSNMLQPFCRNMSARLGYNAV